MGGVGCAAVFEPGNGVLMRYDHTDLGILTEDIEVVVIEVRPVRRRLLSRQGNLLWREIGAKD